MKRIRILIEKYELLRPACHNGTNDGVNAGPVSFVACIEPPHSGRSYPSPVQTSWTWQDCDPCGFTAVQSA